MLKKKVSMRVSESLYRRVEDIRKEFRRINGINISSTDAGDILARRTRNFRVPNLLKNEKHNKKSRPY